MAKKIHKSEIEIRSDHAQAVAGLKAIRRHAGRMVPSLSQVSSAMKIATLAAGGLTVALFAMTKSTAEALDQQQKFSDQLGVTTEFLSKMAFAADLSGIKSESLRKHIQKFTIAIGEADNKMKIYTDAFDKLGVNIEKNDGQLKTSEEILLEVADGFERLKNNTDKVNVAYKLFGGRGVEMLQLLKQGRVGIQAMWQEAETLGLVITEDAGKAAALFNDSLTRLTGAMTGSKNAISEDLMPPMTRFFNVAAIWIASHRTDVVAMARDWATAVSGMAESVLVGGAEILDWFSDLASLQRNAGIAALEMEQAFEQALLVILPESAIEAELLRDRITEIAVEIVGLQGTEIISVNSIGRAEKVKQAIQEIKDMLINFVPPEVVPNIPEIPELGGEGEGAVTGPKALAAQREIAQLDAMWEQHTFTERERLNAWNIEQQDKFAGNLEAQIKTDEIFRARKKKMDDQDIKADSAKAKAEAALRRGVALDFINNLQILGQKNKAAFKAWKIGAIARTIITTHEGAQKSYTSLADIPVIGPIIGGAAALAAIAAGLVRVQAIKSQTYSSQGSLSTAGIRPISAPSISTPATVGTLGQVPSQAGLGKVEINITDNRIAGDAIDPERMAEFVDLFAPFFEEAVEDKVITLNVS